MEASCGVTVVRIAECNEIGIIAVVIFNQDTFILKADDGDLVVVVLLK